MLQGGNSETERRTEKRGNPCVEFEYYSIAFEKSKKEPEIHGGAEILTRLKYIQTHITYEQAQSEKIKNSK